MYGLGQLESFYPIPEGAENSNYFVTLKSASDVVSEYVLTVFEAHGFSEIPFFTALARHLHSYGLPVVAPIATLDGMTTGIFCGKPTALFPKLSGSHVKEPTTDQCYAVGSVLAELHSIEHPASLSQPYAYDLAWLDQSLKNLQTYFDQADMQLLGTVIQEYSNTLAQYDSRLGTSIIHGDLFKDNVLFLDKKVTGLIDFYHSGIGHSVLDLAITVNDWCYDPQQGYLPDRYCSLTEGYQATKPLTGLEIDLLPVLLRVAAAKFWIRRAELEFAGKPGKSPEEFRTILRHWEGVTGMTDAGRPISGND